MREGWKCPVCGRGVSPDEKVCDHGGGVTDVRTPWHRNPPMVDPSDPRVPAPAPPSDPWGVPCEPQRFGVSWSGYIPETHTDNTSGQ